MKREKMPPLETIKQSDSIENQEKDFEKIKEEFSEWLLSFFKDYEDINRKELDSKILELLGFKKRLFIFNASRKDFLKNNNYKELIDIFLEKLDIFTEEVLVEYEHRDKNDLNVFIDTLKREFFSVNSLIDDKITSEKILFLSRVGKNRIVAPAIGKKPIRDITSSILDGDIDENYIIDLVLNLDFEEKIMAVNFISSIREYMRSGELYNNNFYDDFVIQGKIKEAHSVILGALDIIENKSRSILSKLLIRKANHKSASDLMSIDVYNNPERYHKYENKINTFFDNEIEYNIASYKEDVIYTSNISSDYHSIHNRGGDVVALYEKKQNKEIPLNNLEKNSFLGLSKKDRFLLKVLYSPFSFSFIESEFSLDLRSLSISKQINFMRYLSKEDIVNFDRLKKLFENEEIQNENLLKSFLSTSEDLEFGENILKIGENFEPEVANKIFKKYSEIVSVADDAENILREEFGDTNSEQENLAVKEYIKELLSKGKKVLSEFSDEAVGNENTSDVLEKLSDIKTENILLVSKYQALIKEKVITYIEDLNSIETKTLSGKEVLDDDKLLESLIDVYKKNYSNYSSEGLENLISNFKERIRQSELHTLQENNQIIAFALTTPNKEKSSTYLSALNVNPALTKMAAGKVLLQNILDRWKIKNEDIYLEATPNNAVHYINQFGFIAIGAEDDPDEDYILSLEKTDVYYESQDKNIWTEDRIKKEANKFNDEEVKISVWMSVDKTEYPKKVNEGYVISQMFRGDLDGEDGNYFLLEKSKKTT